MSVRVALKSAEDVEAMTYSKAAQSVASCNPVTVQVILSARVALQSAADVEAMTYSKAAQSVAPH